jgi:hypothetical protein
MCVMAIMAIIMTMSNIDWDFGVDVSHFGLMSVILTKAVISDQHANL